MKIQGNDKILITPLNWGLGHATRCIPIINRLIKQGFTPVIASDGAALLLLQKEFPNVKTYKLPSYNITYPHNSKLFLLHFLLKIPHFYKTIQFERNTVKNIVETEKITGIISDNRFGCFNTQIKSVYITHQLKVKRGVLTYFASKIHQKIIKNFDACWVPDDLNHTYAGGLSKARLPNVKIDYLGVLSRFKQQQQEVVAKYNYLILLSGPEPSRSQLENIMMRTFNNTSKKVLLVRGKISKKQTIKHYKGIKIVNFMMQKQLQKSIAESEIVIARSGYSTIMDLAVMGKKAFFIPTPGQTEQMFLAKNLERKKIAPYTQQHQFKKSDLFKINSYSGFYGVEKQSEKIEKAMMVFKEPF